jgi:hypothetical protein
VEEEGTGGDGTSLSPGEKEGGGAGGKEGASRKDSRKFLDHRRQLRSEMRSDANERWWRRWRRTRGGPRRAQERLRGGGEGPAMGRRRAGEATKVEEEA